MPISVECNCGRALRVKDELAGRKIRCPDCKGILAVPETEEAPEFEVEIEEEPVLPKPKSKTPPKPKFDDDEEVIGTFSTTPMKAPAKKKEDEDGGYAATPPKSKAKKRFDDDYDEDDDDDDDDRRPKKRKKAKKKKWDADYPPRPQSSPSGYGSYSALNGGSIGTGLLMMIGAVIWFVAGLASGIIFFYPPVLFILGLGAVIKGLTGRD